MRNTAARLLGLGIATMLTAILAIPTLASAQAVTGTLLGNVTDATGAAVPGATITATETQTNISRTTVTNEAGNYIFSSLKNGTYTVEAEVQGFRKVIRQNVRVDVNTTMRVDLTLELGQVTEAVTKITWTATAGGLEPGQFDLFTVSAGPLPTKSNKVVFKVLQTYSDGDVVNWIEPTVKGADSWSQVGAVPVPKSRSLPNPVELPDSRAEPGGPPVYADPNMVSPAAAEKMRPLFRAER